MIDPYACGDCWMPERPHTRRPPATWHDWPPPTQEQIKERMTTRRNDRNTTYLNVEPPAPEDPPIPC